MCDPASIALVGSAAFGYVAQSRAARANQELANVQADYQEQAAAIEMQRGQIEAEQYKARARRELASARAATGASGFENSGSALDTIEGMAGVIELDAEQIKHNASLAAWGARTQAGITRYGGRVDRMAGRYQAAATFLNGMSSAAARFSNTTYGKKLLGTT